MGFVVPGGNAGGLHDRAHGAAVVSAVEQELFDEVGVARYKAAAQARHIAALTETGQSDQALKVTAAQKLGRLQTAQRRFVAEIDFAVALV